MKTKSISVIAIAVVALIAVLGAFCPLFTVNVTASAASDYYGSITATGGSALSAQLHDLIVSTHNSYSSYDDCKNKSILRKTDCGKASDAVMEFYTQEDIVTFTGGSGGSGTWNREHVWAQSLSKTTSGNQLWGTSGAGSDLHHIRPAEKTINGNRGNQKYGYAGSKSPMYAINLPGKGDVLGGYSSGGTFEPLDNVKGDVARIIMYVFTHYSTLAGGSVSCQTYGALPITNIVSESSADRAWQLLLKWNKLDPVDEIETLRNDEVYKIQGNRNPFIDNPRYADAIWGNEPIGETELKSISVSPSSLSLAAGETALLTVSANPSDASNSVTWSTSNPNVATISGGVVTAVGAGTATITAVSVKDSSKTATATVTVKSAVGLEIGGTYKKTYDAGDEFDPSGATVTVKYSDGTSKSVDADDCGWLDGTTGRAQLSEGTTSVTCRYGTLTASVGGISVRRIVSIALSGTAKNTVYGANQTFIPDGLTVTVYYGDSTSEVVSNDKCRWTDQTGSQTLTSVSSQIICEYKGYTCDESEYVDIIIKQVTGISVSGTLAKTEYMIGDKFDPAGLTVVQTFNDGSYTNLPLSQCRWTDQNGSVTVTANSAKLICKYNSMLAEVNASFIVKKVKEVVVSGTPQKTTYLLGNTFVTTGLTVTIRFEQGDPVVISAQDCRWLDNNNSETASLGATSIHCEFTYNGVKYVSGDVGGITVALSPNAQDFAEKVNAVANFDTADEKFQAIKAAVQAYSKLTEAEKQGAASLYKQLTDEIETYNSKADKANADFANVTQTAVIAASQTFAAALLAALYIIGKRS